MPSQSRSARQLPRTRGSQNVTFRPGLPRLRGRWPAGPERATNNAGASLTADPRRGTLSFVTQKFFCFGAINNRFWCDQQQKEHWLDIPFCCHIGWVCTRACKWSLVICRPLTSNAAWCSVFVISKVEVDYSPRLRATLTATTVTLLPWLASRVMVSALTDTT